MLNSLLHFLLPQFSPFDPLQVTFATIILVTLVYTALGVRRHAQAATWDQLWTRGAGAGNGSLDIEHGSVNDLSAAVASRHERLADIMPGMLLILGLLGTFLGLGMALDKASEILSSAAGSGSSDQMMERLMAMMQGLGSKFKTSTWGILAFLTLKIYCSVNAYDERRLAWCVAKMKGEVDRTRAEQRSALAADNGRLVAAIEHLASGLRSQASADGQLRKQQLGLLLQHLEKGQQAAAAQMTQQLEHGAATQATLQEFVAGVGGNIAAMADAASEMVTAARQTGESTVEFRAAIGDFRSTVTEVLSGMKDELNTTIRSMSEVFQSNMRDMAGQLSDSTGKISEAVDGMSTSVEQALQQLTDSTAKSLRAQALAQGEFALASEALTTTITENGKLIEAVREGIVGGLRAVSENSQRVRAQGDRFEELIRQVEASSRVNSSLTQTLERVAAQLPEHGAEITQSDSALQQLVRLSTEQRDTLRRQRDEGVPQHALLKLGQIEQHLASMAGSAGAMDAA